MSKAELTMQRLLDEVAMSGVGAYEELIEEGYPPKVVEAKMRKGIRRGLLECGVSEVRCWLTDAGVTYGL